MSSLVFITAPSRRHEPTRSSPLLQPNAPHGIRAQSPMTQQPTAPSTPSPSARRHVAISMDGNGRWAKQRGLPRVEGHRKGAESVRDVVRAARQLGIQALTLYAFSSQNWDRPLDEVQAL